MEQRVPGRDALVIRPTRIFGFAILLALLLTTLFVGTAAAACPDGQTDNDGDGVCTPLDCNDNDNTVYPGAPEICGDGKDNNCIAGGQLEPGGACTIPTNPGVSCSTGSVYACSEDKLSLVCPVPNTGLKLPKPENWSVPQSCVDTVDNDCDTLVDVDDAPDCANIAEICDGYDNDRNGLADDGFFPAKGSTCSVGEGICARNGVAICSADGSGTVCSATAGKPKQEKLGIGNSCSDGLDNDCDGFTDAADVDCQPVASAEMCDGIDNDLDGVIDNGFILGAACSVGDGICSNGGTTVCTPDGTATMCNAFPLPAQLEGPSGATCSDGLDNDCDGTTDLLDASCSVAASDLAVTCSLPFRNGRPGSDCTAWHRVDYEIIGGGPGTVISAELLALSEDGELLGVLQNIKPGDEAHLSSRIDQADWKWTTQIGKKVDRHSMFAPVPLLHVTARDGDKVAEAYCSNIPYLQVMQPDGAVVSVSSGDVINFSAAIPMVSATSLYIKVDGVEILSQLGINPLDDFPGGPFGGTVDINGQMVEVSELIVDAGTSVEYPAANIVTMTLSNLGGGGHIIYVSGEPLPTRNPLTEECHLDDIADAGTLASLGVILKTPAEQAIVSSPVPVSGQVKHGRTIDTLKLNGAPFDIAGEVVFTPGDGENTADQYVLEFAESLPVVPFSTARSGDQPLGVFQTGSNVAVADASDDLGNRAFDSHIFATGNVLSPEAGAAVAAHAESRLDGMMLQIRQDFASIMATTEVPNAFVAGLEESAIDNVFDKVCVDAVAEFKSRAQATIQGMNLGSITVDPDCSCSVTAQLNITSITFGPDFDCDAALAENEMTISMELPDITVTMKAANSCETEGLFGECLAETVIDITAITKIIDPVFTYKVTETSIETNTPPPDDMKSFVIGQVRSPGSEGESLENDSDIWQTNNEINCWGAAVCGFFEGVAGFLIEVFTLGFVDAEDVFDFVSVEWQLADFEDIAGASQPDAVGITDVKIDPQKVEQFGQAAFSPAPPDIEITPAGLTASFSSAFETQIVDPSVPQTPGAVLSPAQAPGPAQGTAAQNGYIVLADDTINQFFASMAESGGLKTSCNPMTPPKTVGDLLPSDCETILIPNEDGTTNQVATAITQGICHAIRGNDCESLVNPSSNAMLGTEQGACHGSLGDNCDTIPVSSLTERPICKATPRLTLSATQPLLFCGLQSVPPQFGIDEDTAAAPKDTLDTTLLLNDLSVAIVVDKDGNGTSTDLAGLPSCYSATAVSGADCNLYGACLDLTVNAQMGLNNSQCEAGETGFVFGVTGVEWSGLQAGAICGAAGPTDDAEVTAEAAGSIATDQIVQNADDYAPPLCAEGLSLGGLLTFQNPKLISINTPAVSTPPDEPYVDYFGIIGEIQ